MLIPELWETPVLMSLEILSMLQQWFACARLSNLYMTCLTTPFNRNVHHHSV
jgi:hypothetical protein